MNSSCPRYLGSFGTAEAAALAYDEEARKIHGKNAKLNFREGVPVRKVVGAMDATTMSQDGPPRGFGERAFYETSCLVRM